MACRDLFSRYDAHVTFCVSHLHNATDEQLDALLELQSDGHEIAFHTRTHPRLGPYLERHGLARWVAEEVDRGIDEHRRAGFAARSFAYPHHVATPDTRKEIVKRFHISRMTRPYWQDRGQLQQRVYRNTPPNGEVETLGSIDLRHKRHQGPESLCAMLDAVASLSGTGVFTGHDLRDRESGAGFYSTFSDLEFILAESHRRSLRFLTLSECADLPVGGDGCKSD